MYIKIDEIHTREAARIMDTYQSLLVEIAPLEEEMKLKRQKLVNIKGEVDALKDRHMPEAVKNEMLVGIMTDYEREVNKLQETTTPLIDKLEQLKKDSYKLYSLLKDKNRGASDEQLRIALGKEIEILKEKRRK
jgi:hypothetical protein